MSTVPHASRTGWLWWLGRFGPPLAMLVVGLLLIVALGVAQRAGWISMGHGSASGQPPGLVNDYTCPMHPQIRQPTPGRCPICGMALVAATSGMGDDLDELSVQIQPAQRRLSNIQTVAARREPLTASIQTVGAVAIDESRMATISSYIDGRLERLYADYTGVKVNANDHLAVVYSPDLYSSQVEYIQTRKTLSQTPSGSAVLRQTLERLVGNSRLRLVEQGMQESQIAELERTGQAKSRLTIYAKTGGTVVEKLAVEGKYITAGEPIYRVADLTTVWLILDLYPENAAQIRYGQKVDAEMSSLPGEILEGRVAFVSPTVDPRKRTVGVRVELMNEDGRLRPGDYASATIYLPIGQTGKVYDADLAGRWISPMHPQIIRDQAGDCPICGMPLVPTSRFGYSDIPLNQPKSLFVPRSALLMAGNNSVVYVESEPGRFELRVVTLGPILRDRVIVLNGLEEGEKVATSGNFLIDSQMQLAGKPSLIDPARALVAPKIRKRPLQVVVSEVVAISGDTGRQLEQLFGAYFAIQQQLAADQIPDRRTVQQIQSVAAALAVNPLIPEDAREQLQTLSDAAQELGTLELAEARQAFKPISYAAIRLAGQVRGAGSQNAFVHFFCPMVKGGGGDWLQSDPQLINPYQDQAMRHCGNKVNELVPVNGKSADPQTPVPKSTP